MSVEHDVPSEPQHKMDLRDALDNDIGVEGAKRRAVQVLQIDLARDVVRDMKRHARQGLTLGFGQHLILRYGHTSKPLRATPSTFRQELYERQPSTDASKEDILRLSGLVSHNVTIQKPVEKSEAEVSAAEAASQKMKDQYAAITKEKLANQTKFTENTGAKKSRGLVNKPSLKYNSPGFNRTNSQTLHTSISQSSLVPSTPAHSANAVHLSQASAQARAQRFALIHLLAFQPLTFDDLLERTSIARDTLKELVNQLCEPSGSGPKSAWALSSRRFKELDPWYFPYSSAEQRQKVIDSAISAFDKQRVSPQDKLWQSLLPVDERNKGKILSRLHLDGKHRKLHHKLNDKADSPSSSPDSRVDTEVNEPEKMTKIRKLKNRERLTNNKAEKSNPVKNSVIKKQPQKEIKYLSSERIEDSDDDFEVAAASSLKPSSTLEESIKTEIKHVPNGIKHKAGDESNKSNSTDAAELKSVGHAAEDNNVAEGKNTEEDKKTTKRKVKKEPQTQPAANPKNKSDFPVTNGTKGKAEDTLRKEPKSQRTADPKFEPKSQSTDYAKVEAKSQTLNGTKRKAEEELKKEAPAVLKTTPQPVQFGSASFGPKRIKGDGSAMGTPVVRPTSHATVKANGNNVRKPAGSAVTTTTVPKPVKDTTTDHGHKKSLSTTPTAASKPQLSRTTKPSRAKAETPAKVTTPKSPASRPTTSSPPIKHSIILATYAEYHKLLQSYKNAHGALPKQYGRSPLNIPIHVRRSIAMRYHHLARLQEEILTDFESIVAAFNRPLKGTVSQNKATATGLIATPEEATASRERCRVRFAAWKARYLAMRDDFGNLSPQEMEALWDEFEKIGRQRRRLVKSCALGFGGLDERQLEEVECAGFTT